MVTVVFNPGDTSASKYGGLRQYDYGQILRIQGLNLPAAVEIHFALQPKGGTSVTRIGTTKDGVTDVLIPDSMLENDDTPNDYSIYAFVYITDATSGKTEYRIVLDVKARPKPEVPGGTDNPDVFREAVLAVREAAQQAAESEKQAEGWAHGREDLPERTEDNAMYYAGQAAQDAEKTSADRKEVGRLVESVSGIGEQVEKVDKLTQQAQKAATDASLHKKAAENAQKGTETAKTEAEAAAGKTAEDKVAVETAKGEVLKAQEAVSTDRNTVESVKAEMQSLGEEVAAAVKQGLQDVDTAKQQAVQSVIQTGGAQKGSVEAAGAKAVQAVENVERTATEVVEAAKSEAVQAVQTEGRNQTGKVTAEGEKQVQAVQDAAQEIIADREQIHANKEGLAKLKEDLNTVIGEKYEIKGTVLSSQGGNVTVKRIDNINVHKVEFDIDVLEGQLYVHYVVDEQDQYVQLTKNLVLGSDDSTITLIVIYRLAQYTSSDCVVDGYVLFDSNSNYFNWRARIDKSVSSLENELFANGSAEVPIDLTWNDGFYYGEGQKMSFGNYCHAKFTVSPGETIRISGQEGVGSTNIAVTFATFDENGKWVGNNIATGSIEYTIPKGVKSIALNHNNINFTVNVSVFRIKNKTRMDVLQEEIDNNYQELSKLPLNGKVVYVLGDSITYLNGSWVNKLSEKTGAKKVINCGRGGATWRWRDSYIPYFGSDIYSKNIVANVSADGKTVNFDGNTNLSNGNLPTDNNNYTYINNEIAFMQRLINEDYEKPNVIIIACGINDTGANCEVYSDELFESKFYTDRDSLSNTVKKTLGGGLRANIEALKALYPTATIIVSTPIQSPYKYFRPYIPNTCTWIKKFAEFYSCPVIDAYSESGISAFFEKGWDDMSYNGDNAGRYLFDGLHPNVDGYKLLSNYFSNRINTIYVSNV